MSLVSLLSDAFVRVAQESTLRGLPVGGTSGQVLTKTSATDFDAGWADAAGSAPVVVTLTAASGDGAFAAPESFAFLTVAFSAACRFRVYRTAAGRTADAARLASAVPTAGCGLLYEFVATGAGSDPDEPFLAVRDAGETTVFYRVDDGPSTITVTIKEF